jgi:hypothetical protein
MMNPDAGISRGQLLDTATNVAWRFKAYDSYGGDEATAIRAIRRKCPGFSSRQYANAFAGALQLYDAVDTQVRERASEFWDAHNSGDDSWPRLLDCDLRSHFPSFRLSTFRILVGMMFYYWHMR